MISLSLNYCEKVIFVWNDTKSGILFARFMCKYALEVSSDFFIGVPNGAKIRNWYDFKMLQKLISVHNFKAAAEGTCAARKKIKKFKLAFRIVIDVLQNMALLPLKKGKKIG